MTCMQVVMVLVNQDLEGIVAMLLQLWQAVQGKFHAVVMDHVIQGSHILLILLLLPVSRN